MPPPSGGILFCNFQAMPRRENFEICLYLLRSSVVSFRRSNNINVSRWHISSDGRVVRPAAREELCANTASFGRIIQTHTRRVLSPLKPKKPPVRGPFKPHPGGNFSVFARLPAAHQNGQYGLLGVQTVLGLFKDLIGVALEGLHRDLLALAGAWRVRPSSVASHCFFSFMPIFSAAA